jgi:hypothetical protein
MKTLQNNVWPEHVISDGKKYVRNSTASLALIKEGTEPTGDSLIVEVLPDYLKGKKRNTGKPYLPVPNVFTVKLLIDDNNHAGYHKAMDALKVPGTVIEITKETYARIFLDKDIQSKYYDQTGYVSGIRLNHNDPKETMHLCCAKMNDLEYYATYGTVAQYKSGQLFKDLPA